MYVFCQQPRCKPLHIVLFELVGHVAVYEKRDVRIEMYGPFRCKCPNCGHKQEYLVERDTITIGVH